MSGQNRIGESPAHTQPGFAEAGTHDDLLYNEHYYQHYDGGIPYERTHPHWARFFASIAERLIQHVHPKSTFDLGCAKGFLVEALRDRGVEAYGVDVSRYAIGQVREDIRFACKVGSVVDELTQHYDVITCIEVLEHVTEKQARAAIRNITAHATYILFSSTPDGFEDPTHINIHSVSYWLNLFADCGFAPDVSFDAAYVAPWALFLKRAAGPISQDLLGSVARTADLQMEVNAKSQRLAQLEKSVNTQQETIRNHEARISSLQRTLDLIRTMTGWKWIKGTYRGLTRSARQVATPIPGASLRQGWGPVPAAADPTYRLWISKNEPTPGILRSQAIEAKALAYRPKISLITPAFNTDRYALARCLESVIQQTYDNWELCLADGGSTTDEVRQVIADYSKRDARIRSVFLGRNRGIAGNSNEALKLATGEYVGFLDHDDTLAPFALYEVARVLNDDRAVDFMYSDEDKIPATGEERHEPYFKPEWSPELFLSYNYVCHFAVIRKTLIDKVGGFREGFDGAQDYDLFLRVVRQEPKIHRIPKVLYHWRAAQGSAASDHLAKPYALQAAKNSIAESLKSRGIDAEVVDGKFPTSYRVKHRIHGRRKVSIIIPTRDRAHLLKRCIGSILDRTAYQDYEILIMDNGSTEQATGDYLKALSEDDRVRIVSYDQPFNFSAINNAAVRCVKSEVLLFLNNDTEVIGPEWLSAMLEHAQRQDVGAVGAKLVHYDQTVQHGGVVLGLGGLADHAHRGFPRASDGYLGRLNVIQNVSAVTAACMMVRKEVFDEVGGFEERLSYCYNDVDLCLKIRDKGYVIVFTPYAELYHRESASGGSRGHEANGERRALVEQEQALMRDKWRAVLAAGDPYYSPNLTLEQYDFSPRV